MLNCTRTAVLLASVALVSWLAFAAKPDRLEARDHLPIAPLVAPAGDGTSVERKGRITSIPALMTPMKFLYALAAPMDEKKLAKKMKADLES